MDQLGNSADGSDDEGDSETPESERTRSDGEPRPNDLGSVFKLQGLDLGLSSIGYQNWLPKIDFQIPALKVLSDGILSAALPQLAQIAALVEQPQGLGRLFQGSLQHILDALPDLSDSFRGVWPANLRGKGIDLQVDKLKSLMMDEGLPIAWVPRSETIRMVFAAEGPAARRAVYGRRWRGVVTDCEQLTNRMSSVATSGYLRFLRATIHSLREGHPEGAQALAATTLDTAVKEFFNRDSYRQWIGARGRIEPDELPVRRFFITCQLWGIYRHFEVRDGDPTPGTFNRHGSVHAVSARQYSRLNAVLGLAHLTSLLWAIDTAYGARDLISR